MFVPAERSSLQSCIASFLACDPITCISQSWRLVALYALLQAAICCLSPAWVPTFCSNSKLVKQTQKNVHHWMIVGLTSQHPYKMMSLTMCLMTWNLGNAHPSFEPDNMWFKHVINTLKHVKTWVSCSMYHRFLERWPTDTPEDGIPSQPISKPRPLCE